MKFVVLFATLVLASSALASDASVSGKVADQDGAVFENLAVVITNTATHQKSEAKTTRAGLFGPVGLHMGVYKVEIHTKCFKHYSKTVTLSGAQDLRLDISLVPTCRQPAAVE